MNVEEILKTNKKMPLAKRTLIHVALVANKLNEEVSMVLKPFDISVQQFNVLRILRGQNGKPANLSTINERMVTKMSNTTRLVDKLILKGYVNRTVCEKNRRKVEIVITEDGLNILKQIDGILFEAEENMLKNFTEEELHQFNELLDKF
ncbi:MAG: MarR family transcriptional regulator [Maribacter dokdonensis]|jgi:DNA-binding MarR family transcriptional regulator|uniref:DNA-binding transcriptional regulator, MarR family n=1 Tax=Maribacter dokdonensis TaxID=320912 RepID=A0A1H4J8D7_9FLAO|nr:MULTISPECIES: MarR family transcriptional regulator [Maribacter]HAI42892.1 MarR family transcriptional regulator [Maribacter sp.]APA63428.1 MarR family transcriptional regulator [Maribacter sp. 1_2014MBL_MicDiv]KSA11728.1 sensory box, GGDEF family protein [Maribacter dokdonensis DSW-8]MBU2899417.1 MarR family transcriptional regulator [Maribacter dokdonensis]MDP2528005.1 MarR family transcriptional regulator [Maribacter dokdonensis]|tara:strand:- start:51 stop:497 length:447 start_codon:yes stop_codon:yes gene_type:complete